MTGRNSFALYLHLPFCVRKCSYCAFSSFPVGASGGRVVAEYLAALRREMQTAASLLGPLELHSIYCGGGTPTLLEASQLVSLLQDTRRLFCWAADIEITVEANPGTVNQDKLAALHAAGCNRLSLGAQSFRSEELRLLGRIHTPEEIRAAFQSARRAGFRNINLDLIYGLPGQTTAAWRSNLVRALELGPEHLSVYGLSLEEGTPLEREVSAGRLNPCPEDEQLAMWETTSGLLEEAGFERYEIANFARAGFQCRHNLTYWLNRPYLGLGLAAHGYLPGLRYANHADLQAYLQAACSGALPRAFEEHQTREQERTDTIIMGLRLSSGLSLSGFKERFGSAFEQVFGEQLAHLEREGLMTRCGDSLRLTPRGRLLANYVLSFFV